MNKKLIIAGALGLVALGAGAFALAGPGSTADNNGAPAASTEAKASPNDPLIFEVEGSYFAAIGDGKIVRLPDNVKPSGAQADASSDSGDVPGAPATGETPADDEANGADEGSPADDGAQDTPNIPDTSGPGGHGNQDGQDGDADDSDLIFSPALNDAICKMISCHGDVPEVIYDTNISEGICQLVGCETDSQEEDEKPHIIARNCQILGTCEEPTIKDIVIIKRIADRE